MALIDCPDCGHQVSSDAPQCPNCGRPIAFEGADLIRHLQSQQTDSPPVESPEALEEDRQRVWAWVTLAAGIGLVVGSLLPWATISAPLIGTVDITATDGDGMLTLIAGLAVSLIGILGLTRGVGVAGLVSLAILVLLSAFVAFTDLGNVSELAADVSEDGFGAASVGIGLWLVTISSVVGGVGWFGLMFNRY